MLHAFRYSITRSTQLSLNHPHCSQSTQSITIQFTINSITHLVNHSHIKFFTHFNTTQYYNHTIIHSMFHSHNNPLIFPPSWFTSHSIVLFSSKTLSKICFEVLTKELFQDMVLVLTSLPPCTLPTIPTIENDTFLWPSSLKSKPQIPYNNEQKV